MRPSRHSLLLKRSAAVFERKAAEAGESDAPWALRNVYLYQRFMCAALKARSETIQEYLNQRGAR